MFKWDPVGYHMQIEGCFMEKIMFWILSLNTAVHLVYHLQEHTALLQYVLMLYYIKLSSLLILFTISRLIVNIPQFTIAGIVQ